MARDNYVRVVHAGYLAPGGHRASLVKVTERFVKRWQRAASTNASIDLTADLMRYTVDVTAGLALEADVQLLGVARGWTQV